MFGLTRRVRCSGSHLFPSLIKRVAPRQLLQCFNTNAHMDLLPRCNLVFQIIEISKLFHMPSRQLTIILSMAAECTICTASCTTATGGSKQYHAFVCLTRAHVEVNVPMHAPLYH